MRLCPPRLASSAACQAQVRCLHGLGSVHALQASDDEMATRDILEMIDEQQVDDGAPAAPIAGTDWAITFSVTGIPKRVATWVMSRMSAGAPSCVSPRCAMHSAASASSLLEPSGPTEIFLPGRCRRRR